MSKGRNLMVGDQAVTDYNGPGPMVRVTIVERDDRRLHGHSQSGIMFRVTPNLRNGNRASWYDADWFEPAPNVELTGAERASPAKRPVDVVVRFRAETMEQVPLILDPCCGSRMMWFDRGHKDVAFGDLRSETLTVTDRSHGNENGTRTLCIEPDALMDFRALPYQDETFYLVAFDPPHLVRAGQRSWLAAKYGKLGENWRDDLRQGFAECFRVLRPHGTLVFKWNETQVKVREVLELAPHPPLFGNTAGRKNGTHWVVFMKPNVKVTG